MQSSSLSRCGQSRLTSIRSWPRTGSARRARCRWSPSPAPYSAGKSTLLKHWGFGFHRCILGDQVAAARQLGAGPGLIADWVPVVYVTLMASSSIRRSTRSFCSISVPTRGPCPKRPRPGCSAPCGCTEFAPLSSTTPTCCAPAAQRAEQVLDYIKFLNTELGEINNGTVILVGANLQDTAVLDDPQIRARLTTMTIDAFQISTVEKRAAWRDLLATAGDRPLKYVPDAPADLFVAKLAQHIWRRTQGFVGEVAKLVTGSVLDAVHDRRSHITHDDLDAIKLSERSIDGQLDEAAKRKRRS